MKSQKAKIVLAIFLILCAAIIFWAFTFGKKNDSAPKGGARGAGNTEFSVITKIVREETLHGFISANGEIESQNSVSVFPDTSGKVISTEVMLGSTVRRGQVIAYIDPSRPGERFNSSPVYAPISGSIITVPVKNGTTVSTTSAITQIGDISNLQITADIPERYVSFLRNGLKAHVSVEAYPDVVFDATVTRVSPVVDSISRTKQIILHFDSRDSRINAGMFAKLILFTMDYSGAVTMPAQSLVTYNDKFFAYVVKDDSTVERREVTLGENVGGTVQIISGLKEGERVVIQGQTSLSDGAKIRDISSEAN
ncbi:MAG: efflux RND transporter periplasmic adaptor subunit [Treponema sp.]|nr:efflux RND transporter periplasmic adaptor subunit [Treponema sp.]